MDILLSPLLPALLSRPGWALTTRGLTTPPCPSPPLPMCFPGLRGGGEAGTSRGTLGSWEKARLAGRGSLAAPRPTSPLLLQVSPSASLLLFASPSLQVSVFPVPFSGRWHWGLCLVGPTEMLSARDRRDGLPAEGAAAGLQGFAVDKTFLSSLKGILLETELVTATSPTWRLHLSQYDLTPLSPCSVLSLGSPLGWSPFRGSLDTAPVPATLPSFSTRPRAASPSAGPYSSFSSCRKS